MQKSILGRTGLEVTKLSLGGCFISNLGGEFDQSKEAALYAMEQGINYVDTAPAPSYGNSEAVLGNILAEHTGSKPFVASKIGCPPPFNPKSKKDIIESVAKSLEKLKVDYLDILLIHEPERSAEHDWWDNELTCEGPVIEAMDEMKKMGMIKYTGIGGTTAHELGVVCNTGKFDVVLTAFNYSLLWREAEYSVFPAAKKHNMGVIAASPLMHGSMAVRHDDEINNGAPWITEPRREQFKLLYKLLDETGIGIVEMAMRFVNSNPIIDTVLTGSRSKKEVAENIEFIEKGPLPDDILKKLDEIYSLVPFRPSLEQFDIPFGNEKKPIGFFW